MPDRSRHEKTAVLLRLALEIAARPRGVTSAEARDVLSDLLEGDASLRTAQRLLAQIDVAFPGDFARDEETGRWRWIGRRLPDLALADETDALATLRLAAQDLVDRGDADSGLVLHRLATKLQAADATRAGRGGADGDDRHAAVLRALETEARLVRPGPEPAFEGETLTTVREALRSGKALRFSYPDRHGVERAREVAPYGVLLGEVAYLVARVLHRDEPVLWRLDRVIEPVVGDADARAPEGFDLAAYAARSFGIFQGEEDRDVVLRVAPEHAETAEWHRFHASQTHEWTDDGALLVRLRGRSLAELAVQLLPWGGRLTILEPEDLKTAVTAAAKRALEMTR